MFFLPLSLVYVFPTLFCCAICMKVLVNFFPQKVCNTFSEMWTTFLTAFYKGYTLVVNFYPNVPCLVFLALFDHWLLSMFLPFCSLLNWCFDLLRLCFLCIWTKLIEVCMATCLVLTFELLRSCDFYWALLHCASLFIVVHCSVLLRQQSIRVYSGYIDLMFEHVFQALSPFFSKHYFHIRQKTPRRSACFVLIVLLMC